MSYRSRCFAILVTGLIVMTAVSSLADPRFDNEGNLLRPEGYREWIYVGTPVTPNDMNNGKAPFPEFHNVYMDPASWMHFKKTGTFPNGTMLVKELVSVGSKAAVSGNGYFMGATPFLSDLAYAPNLEQHDLTTLQLFLSAGAAIPRQLVTDARERLGCSISAGWGMTENALVTVNQVDDPPEKVFGTDGCCVNGMEVQVIDDDGQPLTAGEEGDLVSRGPQHFAGYYQRPQITAESFTEDGWFKTGDRAILDDDGYISICGRSKDIIIRGGENIPVVEVENLLHKHPKVLNVAIVGMPDARLQEKACAFVIPQPGETLTFGDMVDYLLEQQLAKQYLPERLEIVTEFPMTPSGKVQKYQLRQHIAALLEQEGN